MNTIMYRYWYIGQLKDGGDLNELTGVVATQLKGSNIRIIQIKSDAPPAEISHKLAAFWCFVGTLQPGYRENAIRNITESGKIPTATLSFDSSLPPDDLLLPTPYGMERNEMLEFFATEADFIGFIQLQYILASKPPEQPRNRSVILGTAVVLADYADAFAPRNPSQQIILAGISHCIQRVSNRNFSSGVNSIRSLFNVVM
jgi:hypothetical protein